MTTLPKPNIQELFDEAGITPEEFLAFVMPPEQKEQEEGLVQEANSGESDSKSQPQGNEDEDPEEKILAYLEQVGLEALLEQLEYLKQAKSLQVLGRTGQQKNIKEWMMHHLSELTKTAQQQVKKLSGMPLPSTSSSQPQVRQNPKPLQHTQPPQKKPKAPKDVGGLLGPKKPKPNMYNPKPSPLFDDALKDAAGALSVITTAAKEGKAAQDQKIKQPLQPPENRQR